MEKREGTMKICKCSYFSVFKNHMAILSCCLKIKVEATHYSATYSLLKIMSNSNTIIDMN
jgi:hypothetical protein